MSDCEDLKPSICGRRNLFMSDSCPDGLMPIVCGEDAVHIPPCEDDTPATCRHRELGRRIFCGTDEWAYPIISDTEGCFEGTSYEWCDPNTWAGLLDKITDSESGCVITAVLDDVIVQGELLGSVDIEFGEYGMLTVSPDQPNVSLAIWPEYGFESVALYTNYNPITGECG